MFRRGFGTPSDTSVRSPHRPDQGLEDHTTVTLRTPRGVLCTPSMHPSNSCLTLLLRYPTSRSPSSGPTPVTRPLLSRGV